MNRTWIAGMIGALVSAGAALAADPPGAVSVPVGTYLTTMTGQQILTPQGPIQVSVARTTIPAGGAIPAHKHPFLRKAYILEGSIRVTNLDTGAVQVLKAGDFAVEARDQWHMGEALDGKPAVLLVIDETPPGQGNMVRKAP